MTFSNIIISQILSRKLIISNTSYECTRFWGGLCYVKSQGQEFAVFNIVMKYLQYFETRAYIMDLFSFNIYGKVILAVTNKYSNNSSSYFSMLRYKIWKEQFSCIPHNILKVHLEMDTGVGIE